MNIYLPTYQRMRRGPLGERTVDEQIACIRQHRMNVITPSLRSQMLRSLGIPKPRPTAENLIKLGCYIPFAHPRYVQGYFKLLQVLDIDYTYLENEYCCGGLAIQSNKGAEQEKALRAGKEFMQMNCDIAREKGAKNIAYLCSGCVHFAKGYFPEDESHHLYSWDLIADKLEERTLNIGTTRAAYFGGCGGTRFRVVFPKVKLQWERFRNLMNRVEGLTLIDIARNVCCQVDAERIVQETIKQNLGTIVCSCNGCRHAISDVANGRVQVKYLSDILVVGLGEKLEGWA